VMQLTMKVVMPAAAAVGVATIVLLLRRRRGVQHHKLLNNLAQPAVSSDVPRVTEASVAIERIRAEGVCVVEGVLDTDTLQNLTDRLAAIEPRKRQNRRAHRWELVHSPETPPLAELAAHPMVVEMTRGLLGPKYYLEKAGLIMSHHGAEIQRWHMDTPHLFSVGTHLPPHSVSVFVPLCDLVPSNGPTEFQLATHIKANLVQKQRHAIASCPAGSLVCYDPRIMHRGGANQSGADRPLIYLTFSRIWYRDTLNP